ncbi:MAG: hypothetical protein HZA90_10340 [Verrucomicrobia bacterium]|nr:hypothetical protein [Verrucomicrobiota bacterium]
MVSTIERARRYIAKCAPAISGQGGHDATFHVAAVLVHGFALSKNDALMLLREWNVTCQPSWSERELLHKVASAASAQQAQPRGYLLGNAECGMRNADFRGERTERTNGVEGTKGNRQSPIANSQVEPVVATERWLKGFRCGEADLRDASAVVLEGDPRFDGAVLVRALYAPGERINFVTEFAEHTEKSGEVKARPLGKGITLERDALVSRFEQHGSDSSNAGGWLRMNPVDGQGIGDANVTACRFALLESDTLPMELQLALFAKLPLPIAAILSSGGRSVHAWVKLDARDAAEYRAVVPRLLGLLAKFGVDGKNKNPSRLSRLPGAVRVIGAVGDGVQRLLYVNPQPAERSIL